MITTRRRDARNGGGWEVFADGDDFPNVLPGVSAHIGAIGPRGRMIPRADLLRTERRVAMHVLDRARENLIREGELRDDDLERRRADEARNGSFIVELDNGDLRRFNTLRTEYPSERGTARYRPGALDWAEAEISAGAARHADIFRAPTAGERSEIYKPRILAARGEHPAILIGDYEHLPLQQLNWARNYTSSPAVQRAYGAKGHAMDLVNDRLFFEHAIPPSDIADAWEVAHDAFVEAGLPLQQTFAQKNADYWRFQAGQRVGPYRAQTRARTRRGETP